jgi:PAS domain S-box-containing protein
MSKKDSVGKAIHEMHENLLHLTEQHNENSWMQNGKERLNDILRGEKNVGIFGNEILTFFFDFLGSQLGTFFISKSETTLSLVHSFGTTGEVPSLIQKDNSFIGQALTQKKVVVLNDVDKDYFKVSTSLGSAKAASILIIPLFVSNKIVGLIEIGKLSSFTPLELRFIDDITESIAIYVNSILAKAELEKLVLELDSKEQELQNQIKAINKAAFVIEFDTNGFILSTNDLFLKILGYNKEELIGQHHKILTPKHIDYDLEYGGFWESLNKGNNESGEFCRNSKDNKEVWFQASYNPVFDENGKVYKVIKIGYDITELKQQRIDLDKLTLNLNQQVEVLNKTAIVSETDADGNIIFVNDFFCEISEYSREELIGKNHRILKSGKQSDGIFVGMWKAISTGLMWQGEILNISKTGKYYWVETTIMPFKNKDGKIEKYVALRFDITKQKESEELKKQLESTTLNLNQQVSVLNKAAIVSETDADGNIIFVNDFFCSISEYTREELIGKNHRILKSGKQPDGLFKGMWKAISTGLVWQGEILNVSKTGKYYWVETTIMPFKNNAGKVEKYVAIRFDITKQKESEALKKQTELLLASQRELEESNTELEAQTQKLQASEEELRVQQEELMQSNKELEEKTKLVEEKNHAFNEKNILLVAATTDLKTKADQLSLSSKYKSEFLANMSHELRTPLNSILLLSKLLQDNLEDNLSEDQIEYSTVINKAGNSLLELINDILDLSKIESGKMDVNAETLILNKFTGDIHSLFNPIAKDKEIEFNVVVNSDCPISMYTDKMRLDQVVKNLLSNAFKFSPKGKVNLSISYNLQQDMISFSVVDTGIGIAKEKQALVFEAFQQADGSTKRKYGGTGLGLSISKEIAHLLGGEITLESEVGVGSNFTITIPANYSPENLKKQTKKNSSILNNSVAPDLTPDKESEISVLVDDDRHLIEKKDKTILIVEDDIYFVKILQNSAKSRGYKVLVAVNGNEAVELAKKHIPTGIILDLHLPKKSGWEVLKELKDFAETKHIPVHIVSSQDLDSKITKESGAIDFTNKPISDDNLQKVFRSLEEIATKENGKIALFSDKIEHALAMTEFLKERQIEIITFTPDSEIDNSISKNDFDAIIIDVDTRRAKVSNLLEKLTKVLPNKLMPVIVLSNTYLSSLDIKRINQYNESFILKIVKSYSNIIDEMSLFLHYITKKEASIKMRPAIISAKALEKKKILLVDDDAENRFSIGKILEAQKAEVLQATNGKEAIDVWKNNKDISLILMDVMMPEMDGYEAIKEIRKLENGKNIPIISLTARTQADEREKCISSGASDYASKPIDADLLISLSKIWILNSDKNK